jgi:hypothetical protein
LPFFTAHFIPIYIIKAKSLIINGLKPISTHVYFVEKCGNPQFAQNVVEKCGTTNK